jgi:hypothetical protein
MGEKRGKLLEILNSKLVIIVLVFAMFFLATVFAGNVIVKEGSMEIEENLNSSGVLYVNSTTGRVGVGTANPATKLGIDGDLRCGSATNYFQIDTSGRFFTAGGGDYLIGDNRYMARSSTFNDVGVYFNAVNAGIEILDLLGASRLYVGIGMVGTGRFIGVGTQTPAKNFDVKGNISLEAGSGSYYSSDGSQGITQSETSVTDFDIVIKDGIITSFTKNA